MTDSRSITRRSAMGLAAASLASAAIAGESEEKPSKEDEIPGEKSSSSESNRRVGAVLEVGDGKILKIQQDKAFVRKPDGGGLGTERRKFELPEGTKSFCAWLVGWSAMFHDAASTLQQTEIAQIHIKLDATIEGEDGVVDVSAWWSDDDDTNDPDRLWTADIDYLVVAVG